ncbi:MAG TPA: tRNA (adenosine(37)-N6)-threonylcarbamoyltransferase complex dimerization subunit type 1 TsaB [Dissulfurispiraceae bacterium]|nr:tRNA (adenosine(37)-N6)-threonylcarbamoyltransferase complex dimerization subunit type 1 TsaB [Dissulfurispiraceae bacterium]
MKLLAVETATMLGGIAIMDGMTLVAESRINVRVTHSERLMKEIDHALTTAGMDIGDIDVFGISAGPGSFTGLRVGLSTVKGLVYATGKKIVSVPTLEAFAWNVPFSDRLICPMLDARRKEVYAALFRWSADGFTRVMNEQALKAGRLVSMIDSPTVFLGEGAVLNRQLIEQELGDKALFGAPPQMVPSPANVAFLCMRKAVRGEYGDALAEVPAYLRRSEAEIKFAV